MPNSTGNEQVLMDLLQPSGTGYAFGSQKIKSIIHIGPGMQVHVSKRFNWFQKKMLKWCFGFEVEDVNDG